MLGPVFATATCLSVCPSVCLDVRLSHAGIVPNTAKAGSYNVHHILIAPSLWFLARYDSSKNSQGVTPKERAEFGDFRTICRHIWKTVHFRHKVTMGR